MSGQYSQASVVDSLPSHLRPFVSEQRYQDYTPREQASWRFIMHNLVRQLRDVAHPVYLEGLARTGIALDHIPSIDEMNRSLAQLGWSAVVVDGFIPPAIFMEFQSLKVLVIARDMRSVDHILYTPAPDIVHEAAGHAPFIVDIDYSEYLQRFGEVGMRAIASRYDHELYEAVRSLSLLKESATATDDEVGLAESRLAELATRERVPSEAELLTRLHWWTVEYGLVGPRDDYRLFGAGLLSSLGESEACQNDDKVRKRPLTVEAINTAYDITSEQPQLFVTKSCKHLNQVLEEFVTTMAWQVGGRTGLERAVAAGTVCTAQYDTGLSVSGRFVEVVSDAVGKPIYLRSEGPTQLAADQREIPGHGVARHGEGFGSPVGHLANFSRCLSSYTVDELGAHAIVIGQRVRLEYVSGVTVSGLLTGIYRHQQKNLLLSFDDCTVTDLSGRVLFDPAWGSYDMAVGARIDAVYGGVADRSQWQLYAPVSANRTHSEQVDEALMALYREVADCRDTAQAEALLKQAEAHPREWLLRWELIGQVDPARRAELQQEVVTLGTDKGLPEDYLLRS